MGHDVHTIQSAAFILNIGQNSLVLLVAQMIPGPIKGEMPGIELDSLEAVLQPAQLCLQAVRNQHVESSEGLEDLD